MASSKRYVTVHGHFYQPPRENPWLEAVETQDSAAPYHDWNDRICSECYATNGAARLVNHKNLIVRIVNNYAHMSFNFGPTLLSWMEELAPRAYQRMLEGEASSRKRYSGHSSALAQVYNHIILPLANERDKRTQIRWGIADYEHRLGIKPEGMWLAETAADSATLRVLAEEGIRFTVLAPHQAHRVRALSGGDWIGTPESSVDTTHPYLVRFSDTLSIAVFFYDGPTSRAIAFEGLLNSGEGFATRLKSSLRSGSDSPQLAHVATDGESYGHHHRHGEMALAYALQLLDLDPEITVTNYGEFLANFPPQWEVEIVENSSWSCLHGVERWRSNCGCNGGAVGWNQKWRAPLRAALDQLRDSLIPLSEALGAKLFHNLWEARNAYIKLILQHSAHQTESYTTLVDDFLKEFSAHSLTAPERVQALQLLELQRHSQLMYTSCGWFFDDISGIETVQILAYAGRALQLANYLFASVGPSLREEFLEKLAMAQSNQPENGNGRHIFEQKVGPLTVTLEQVAAHYAISAIFSTYPEDTELFCYRVQRDFYEIYSSGRGRLSVGRVHITSLFTETSGSFIFSVLHFGDQNITAAVKPWTEEIEPGFQIFTSAAKNNVAMANFPEVIRLLDRTFGHAGYSLSSLFTDEQRRILQVILNSTLGSIENSLSTIYEDHANLLHYLNRSGLPKPPALTLAAGFAINSGLRRALETEPFDVPRLRSLLVQAAGDGVELDKTNLSFIADQRMKRAMIFLLTSHSTLEALESATSLARMLNELPFELNLWQAQNIWYEIRRSEAQSLAALEPSNRHEWERQFNQLGRLLAIDVANLVVE